MRFLKRFAVEIFISILLTAVTAAIVWPKPQPVAISAVLISDETGRGSGVHVGDGYVVTAAHVVGDRTNIQVTDSAGKEQVGNVLWVNKAHDVALIRVVEYSNIRRSTLVCKPQLRIGDELQAVGNPINLRFVHAWGRVATLIAARDPWRAAFIADMTIAPGMSGGPVFDRSGGIVGIAVGVSALPQPFAVVPVAFAYIVPSSAVCMLMGRT